MAKYSKTCEACGASVSYDTFKGFKTAHAHCPMKGKNAADATHPPCPTHGTLVWVVGPYSTFRQCSANPCNAGKAGKPYRICAPRGGDGTPDANSDSDAIPVRDTPGFPPTRDGGGIPDDDTDDDTDSTPNTKETTPDMTMPAPNLPTDAQAALAQLLSALQPKQQIDPAALQAMVDKAVDAKVATTVKTTLIIERSDAPKIEIDAPHPYLARLIKLVEAGLHVYLWGPAGGGKTTAAMQCAHALGREHEIDTLDPSTFRSMIQGYTTPTGDPVHTSFTRSWTSGKIYIADENDLAPGHVQTLFNSSLANGHAPLAWGNVTKVDTFGFIGCGNTPGMPTREFPDRKPMSAAYKDRLYFMYWPLDEQGERAWAVDPNTNKSVGGRAKNQIPTTAPRTCTAAQWVDYVQAMREWCKVNAPTIMITPRASITGLKALACGETPEQVADGMIFRGADSELRSKALNAVRLP